MSIFEGTLETYYALYYIYHRYTRVNNKIILVGQEQNKNKHETREMRFIRDFNNHWVSPRASDDIQADNVLWLVCLRKITL